jgi:hypothetical protein
VRLRNSLIILGVLEDQDIEWFVRVGQTTVLQEADILIEEGVHIEFIGFVLDGALTVTTVHDTRKVLGLCISASLNAPIEETSFGVFRM